MEVIRRRKGRVKGKTAIKQVIKSLSENGY